MELAFEISNSSSELREPNINLCETIAKLSEFTATPWDLLFSNNIFVVNLNHELQTCKYKYTFVIYFGKPQIRWALNPFDALLTRGLLFIYVFFHNDTNTSDSIR